MLIKKFVGLLSIMVFVTLTAFCNSSYSVLPDSTRI
jgi:hypothetical protein